MPLISLCMIVRDEAEVLGRCLQSVADLVDEIIVADTGSVDETKAIAAQFEAKIYDFPWCDDFSAARNFTVQQAVGDYWMWLDADDVIEGENRARLKQILQSPDADLVYLPYVLSFDSAGKPDLISKRERIFRRSKGYRFEGAVHEAVVPHGVIRMGDAAVFHRKEKAGDPDRNLRIYQQKRLKGERFSPREQYYYGRELIDHGADTAALSVLEHFLQEGKGWEPDCIGACLLCAKVYEKRNQVEQALQSLLRALSYGVPTPEICCEIGACFMKQEQWKTAAFWYQTALREGAHPFEGFRNQACCDYIPAMQLCVCYDRMGDISAAAAYNALAGNVRPQDRAVEQNRQYFASKGIMTEAK